MADNVVEDPDPVPEPPSAPEPVPEPAKPQDEPSTPESRARNAGAPHRSPEAKRPAARLKKQAEAAQNGAGRRSRRSTASRARARSDGSESPCGNLPSPSPRLSPLG